MSTINTKRIEANIKNLDMALKLINVAFEDLKNIESFRENEKTNLAAWDELKLRVEAAKGVAQEIADKSSK